MKTQLTQNLWERYGFRDNPFDTRALALTPGSGLSVSEAFVGRKEKSTETKIMTNFLKISGGGRIIVEGDVGVGKTTFVNYHRYRWENEATTKLMTPASEISVQQEWGARDFLLSILGSLGGRLALTMKRHAIEKDQLLTKIFALTGVLVKELTNISGGINIIGTGGTVSRSKSLTVQLGEITLPMLRDYLEKLMDRVHDSGFAGGILHLNNMELLAKSKPSNLRRFFEEVRDYLQQLDLYFIFVGYTGMFQEVIVPLERVRSIFFGQPIYLPPLKCEDVHRAIQVRYKLLAIPGSNWRPPVDESLIDYLYKVFSGKIRFIMDSITTIVTHLPEGVTGTMSTEGAQQFLRELTRQRLGNLLTQAEKTVLMAAIEQQRFTNLSLGKSTNKSKQNIAKYLKRFVKLNLISQTERKGKNVYYEVAPDLCLLRPDSV